MHSVDHRWSLRCATTPVTTGTAALLLSRLTACMHACMLLPRSMGSPSPSLSNMAKAANMQPKKGQGGFGWWAAELCIRTYTSTSLYAFHESRGGKAEGPTLAEIRQLLLVEARVISLAWCCHLVSCSASCSNYAYICAQGPPLRARANGKSQLGQQYRFWASGSRRVPSEAAECAATEESSVAELCCTRAFFSGGNTSLFVVWELCTTVLLLFLPVSFSSLLLCSECPAPREKEGRKQRPTRALCA